MPDNTELNLVALQAEQDQLRAEINEMVTLIEQHQSECFRQEYMCPGVEALFMAVGGKRLPLLLTALAMLREERRARAAYQ